MVKIYATQVAPDYSNPWRRGEPEQSSGSGCVIGDKYILTNAHVVSYGQFIQVRPFGQAVKYKARLVAISHELDLALLTVNDEQFFLECHPLEVGDLPRLQEEVLVYGFPEGGDTLSITKGVVSRVEYRLYAHSFKRLLAMQVDAAVNFGNSGGPIIADGKIVAVAMQSLTEAENINYAIPAPVIKHFLDDLRDGTHDGTPELSVRLQHLENASLRRKFGLENDHQGVLIYDVGEGSAAEGIIQKYDVLLKVDGYSVSADGSIEFRDNERVDVAYCIDQHQVGDIIKIDLLREGTKKQVKFALGKDRIFQVQRGQYPAQPSYFIFGGLVFSPLTINYLQSWGDEWFQDAPTDLLYSLINGRWKRDRQDIVTLIKVLPHDVNVGYHEEEDEIIIKVDGVAINSFSHFVSLVQDGAEPFIEFTTREGRIFAIDRKQASDSAGSIMQHYGISSTRSLKDF